MFNVVGIVLNEHTCVRSEPVDQHVFIYMYKSVLSIPSIVFVLTYVDRSDMGRVRVGVVSNIDQKAATTAYLSQWVRMRSIACCALRSIFICSRTPKRISCRRVVPFAPRHNFPDRIPKPAAKFR
jgi:hypothetical protein